MIAQSAAHAPAEVLHIVPDLPGVDVPPGAIAVPAREYDLIRRRAIAQQMRERAGRIQRGDFSDFIEVTEEEKKTGRLNG